MVAQSTLVLNQIQLLHHQFGGMLDVGFLIFSRMLGFILIAPLFGRKDIPFYLKMGIALAFTGVFIWTVPEHYVSQGLVSSDNMWWFLLQIAMNVMVGYIIGFIARTILMGY